MLIKQVTRDGKPVAFDIKELLPFAIERGLKTKNTTETVYWARKESLKVDNFSSSAAGDKGAQEGFAEGTVGVGKTVAKTDEFYEPKAHTFSVRYKTSKDDLGLPDIEIVSFQMSPVQTNPSENIGPVDRTNEPKLDATVEEFVAPRSTSKKK